jgi:hypothetical protein
VHVISATGVPASDWRNAWAICSSVKRDFFKANPFSQGVGSPEISSLH